MLSRDLRWLAVGVLLLLACGVVRHLIQSWILVGVSGGLAPAVEQAHQRAERERASDAAVRSVLRERGQLAMIEARHASTRGESRALGGSRWSLVLAPLLDLGKIVGVFLIVLATLRMMRDPEARRRHQTAAP